MSRKVLFDTRQFPYHITARANNREAFPGDLKFVWRTLTSELFLQSALYEVRIHALVLMPNHFHLLATAGTVPIDKTMQLVLGSATRILNSKYERWGRIFGGRYHWTSIQDPIYYAHATKYVFRNPVKAKLCNRVGDYPFSTFSCLVGAGRLPLPITRPFQSLDRLLPSTQLSFAELDDWLNIPHRREENLAIKAALRRKIFELPVKRNSRRKIPLEAGL